MITPYILLLIILLIAIGTLIYYVITAYSIYILCGLIASIVLLFLLPYIVCPPVGRFTTGDRASGLMDYFFEKAMPVGGVISNVVYLETQIRSQDFKNFYYDHPECFKDERFSSIQVAYSMWYQSLKYVGIDEEYHFKEVVVKDTEELETVRMTIINSYLDDSKPLWQYTVLVNNGDESHNAVIVRFNHALCDGLRICQLFDDYMKFEDGSRAEIEIFKKMKENATARTNFPIGTIIFNYFADFFGTLVEQLKPIDDKVSFNSPGKWFDHSVGTDIAEFQAYDLNKFKEIKNYYKGTTLNDILYTVFVNALYRYDQNFVKDFNYNSKNLSVILAYGYPAPSVYERCLYNDMIILKIPFCKYSENIEESLEDTKKIMGAIKYSFIPYWTLKLINAMFYLGFDFAIQDTNKKLYQGVSFVYSNVPSYSQDVWLFGKAKVKSIHSYFMNVNNQVIFISVKDKIFFNLTTNTSYIKDYKLLFCLVEEVLDQWHKSVISKTNY